MTGNKKVTNFDDLDKQKENIVPIKEGRSAHRLVQALGLNEDHIKEQRAVYMTKILTQFDEHDDPLSLYLEYIDWINHVFPQGGSSKQSGMLSVIEDCIIRIKDMEMYRNDPRYVKLWLWYMELFTSKYKADCRDLFFFMLRNKIGYKLSELYEELSGLLLELNQRKYAIAILELGIEESAQPVSELIHRRDMLLESNAEFTNEQDIVQNLIPEAEQIILGSKRSDIIKTRERKPQERMVNDSESTIFRDSDGIEEEPIHFHSWRVFEDLKTRNKENKVPVLSLDLSKGNRSLVSAGEKSDKITIFQDDLGRSAPKYKVIDVPGKKKETIDFNIDLLMTDIPQKEQCTEEILAVIYQRRRTKLVGKRLNVFKDGNDHKRAKVCAGKDGLS